MSDDDLIRRGDAIRWACEEGAIRWCGGTCRACHQLRHLPASPGAVEALRLAEAADALDRYEVEHEGDPGFSTVTFVRYRDALAAYRAAKEAK